LFGERRSFGRRGRRQPLEVDRRRRQEEDGAGQDERASVGERAAAVRAVVSRVIEPRLRVVVVIIIIVVFAAGAGMMVMVVVVVVVFVVGEKDDRAVDVNMVVAVVQRVQPRQDCQRGAERAEHESRCLPPAAHSGAECKAHPGNRLLGGGVTISRRRTFNP
jgi:hypothetical protein